MVRLWATGTVPFKSTEEILADKQLLAINVLWVLIIPVWRDIHFYIAHRFLHIRAVYTYVHKLHHRCVQLRHRDAVQPRLWHCVHSEC